MIKADQLVEFRTPLRYTDGASITIPSLQSEIKSCAGENGVPVAFRMDQVKSGGLLNSSFEDCLVLYHPAHPNDYFNFCIRVKHQGNFAFVSVDTCGQSKQMAKFASSAAHREARRGQSLSHQLGDAVFSGIINMGKNKQKLEEEQLYYDCIDQVLAAVIY